MPRDTTRRSERGLRLIIAYKLVRSAAALGGSLMLVAITAGGRTAPLSDVVKDLRHHVTSAWSIELAVDGSFTLLEAWALRKERWWGPWLVVVATTAFVPFEVFALFRRLALGRVIVLCANVTVAIYLAMRIRRAPTPSAQRKAKTSSVRVPVDRCDRQKNEELGGAPRCARPPDHAPRHDPIRSEHRSLDVSVVSHVDAGSVGAHEGVLGIEAHGDSPLVAEHAVAGAAEKETP
jgi:Predicted membrane protein (DUF2127)